MEQQISDLPKFAVIIVLASVMCVVGVYIISQLPGSSTTTSCVNLPVNDSFATFTNDSTLSLSKAPVLNVNYSACYDTGCSVDITDNIRYWNATTGKAAFNQSFSETQGQFAAGVVNGTGYPLCTADNVCIEETIVADENGNSLTNPENWTFDTPNQAIYFTANMTNVTINWTYNANWTDVHVLFYYESCSQVTSSMSNVSRDAMTGVSTYNTWLSVVAMVFAAVILIGILIAAFKPRHE